MYMYIRALNEPDHSMPMFQQTCEILVEEVPCSNPLVWCTVVCICPIFEFIKGGDEINPAEDPE